MMIWRLMMISNLHLMQMLENMLHLVLFIPLGPYEVRFLDNVSFMDKILNEIFQIQIVLKFTT